jgi:hypothetical protein
MRGEPGPPGAVSFATAGGEGGVVVVSIGLMIFFYYITFIL